MTVLIIEDEPLVAVGLIRLLKELEPAVSVVGPLLSVTDSVEWLKQHPQPDLILSDIQLADGISFDIFNDTVGCPVIFTTAYNEYAVRAFRINSIDYLLKPVEKSELARALQKFHQLQEKFKNEIYLRQVKELFQDFSKPQQYKQRFAVHAGRSVVLVDRSETVGFIKEEIIYLLNNEGRRFITDYRSLDEIEDLLDPAAFFRATRQCILQLAFVEGFRGDDTGRLNVKIRRNLMEDVVISREKAADFRKWFGQ